MSKHHFTVFYRNNKHSRWQEMCLLECKSDKTPEEITTFFEENYIFPENDSEIITKPSNDVFEEDMCIFEELESIVNKLDAKLKKRQFKIDIIDSEAMLLNQKKQKLLHEINDYEKQLTWTGNTSTGALISDIRMTELNLPPIIEQTKCRICNEIVKEPYEHYIRNGWPSWSCIEWNHP